MSKPVDKSIDVDAISWTKVWDDGMTDQSGNFDGMTVQLVTGGPCVGSLAVHDMSGDTPTDCDDGVLWIDTDATLKVEMPIYHEVYTCDDINLSYDCTPRVKFTCRDTDGFNLHHVTASARRLWLLLDFWESHTHKKVSVEITNEALLFYEDYGKTAIALGRTKRPATYNCIVHPNYIEG